MTEYKTQDGTKIEVGKFYKTRDGEKVQIKDINTLIDRRPIYAFLNPSEGYLIYKGNGCFDATNNHPLDLITAWPEETKEEVMTDDKKVIKEFIEMIEDDFATQKFAIKNSYSNGVYDVLQSIRESHEYEALKALAYAPVSKMEITGEIIDLATETYLSHFGRTSENIKASLEAVFASIENVKQCPGCKVNLHKDVCECPLEQATDTQDNDGWVEWKGSECPVNPNVCIEVKIHGRSNQTAKAEFFYWGIDSGIIAYRIIDEPEISQDQIKSDKKIYRLKDMLSARFSIKIMHGAIGRLFFHTREDLDKCFKESILYKLIAITPADQDHFFIGEGLEELPFE